MGDYPYLKVGRKYTFTSMRYQIPYSWCMIFDEISPTSEGFYKTSVRFAKDKLATTGITLDNLERRIAEYSGWDKKYWEKYRKFVLGQDESRLSRKLEKDGFSESDNFYPNVLDLLEQMEEDEGLIEVPALYRLALALEDSQEELKVSLDLTEFMEYYKQDNENPEKILSDVKGTFVGKVDIYNYLFGHIVGTSDRKQLVLDRIRSLNEDQVIDQVLVPLLTKLGFHSIERVPHHGPYELGLDIRPFYEVDKFNNRIYLGAQVKTVNIHTNSRKEGHVDDVVRQISHALDSWFLDKEDNEKKQIDRVILVTSHRVNDSAKEVLNHKFPNRKLVTIEGKALAEYVVKYGLVNRILQFNHTYKRLRKGKRSE